MISRHIFIKHPTSSPHPTRTRTEIPPDAEDPGGGRAGADGADASDPVRSGRPIFSRTRKPQGSRGTDGSQMNRRLRLGSIRAAESSPDPKTPGVARDGGIPHDRPTPHPWIVRTTGRRDPDRRDRIDAPESPMPRTTSDRRLKSRNLRQQKKPDAIISHGATKLKSKNSLQRSHGKTDPPDNYRGGVRGFGRPKKSRTRKLPGSRGTAKVRRRYPIRPTSLSEIVPATQRRDPDRRDPSDAHAAHAKFFGRPEGSRIRKPQGSRGTDGSQMNRRLRLGSARGAGEVPDPKTPGVARDGRFAHETTPSFSGQRCVWTIRGSSPIPRLKTRIIIHPPPCPQGTE